MADEIELESWLEAPYKNDKNGIEAAGNNLSAAQDSKDEKKNHSERHSSDIRESEKNSRSERRSNGERSSRRSRSREGSHRSSRGRSRSPGRGHSSRNRSSSRSRERRRHRSSKHGRSPSPSSRYRRERREYSRDTSRERRRSPVRARPPRSPSPEVSEVDRDQRTVFCTQLAARLTSYELREFFSRAGKVRDARIVSDRNSRRSKGVGYVEFYDAKSVEPAITMTGQKLLGIPIIVQASEAEKNKLAEAAAAYARGNASYVPQHRLYVGNVQFNLTQEDLKALFEPFGAIEYIELPIDTVTGRGRGYAFIQYRRPEDAKIALGQMNGFELGGRPIRVGLVSERTTNSYSLDDPDAGMVLNSQSRAELMMKLSRDDDTIKPARPAVTNIPVVPIVTRTTILENMFDPDEETESDWIEALEDEVKSECRKFGPVSHIYLDEKSKGNIYVKFDTTRAAQQAIQSLNGRWFGGRQVVAKCLPESQYHSKFPRAARV